MELKAEPAHTSPPINVELEQPFVWPWVGVLANIPLQWKDARFVGPTGFILKQQLSRRGCNPLKVEILWTYRGHSGFALLEFEKDYNGLQHATLFDKSFQASRCGNKDWNNAMVCPAVKLYGWIATEDDYKFEGIVGQHLRRKFRDLLNSATMYKRMHSQRDGFSSCVHGIIKQKDEMVQRYHKDMRSTHHCAQKLVEKIISQREKKVTVLLEAQKQDIEMRSTELVDGVVPNETGLRVIQNEKHKIGDATFVQRKGDHNFVLLEKRKKGKEDLHKEIIDFEKDVDDKHVLLLEIERMREALRVMRHMGDAGDGKILEKMDTIKGQLKEKEEEYGGFETMNQTLIVKRETNYNELDLEGDGKELIKCIRKEHGDEVYNAGWKKVTLRRRIQRLF